MPSGVFDSILLRDSWSTEELRAVFSDENRVQKWYDVEATLASEQAAFGIVPREAAGEIMRHAKVEKVDLAAIARAMADAKHPLVPALRALQKLCKPEFGEWLHYGPTTQDILDTGMALQLKEAHAIILRDLRAVGRALDGLAERHRATPMPGRTHGVQALPLPSGTNARSGFARCRAIASGSPRSRSASSSAASWARSARWRHSDPARSSSRRPS